MSVKKDPDGRRSIQVEVEVDGTPEQVWKAIATGPGVSSWFVPVEVEERVGGKVVSHFGPGMDSVATVTAWDPPHRFAAESHGLGPKAPAMATEWTVEARSGGTCVVRVVHSLFASTDDWDNQLESIESGWPAFFRILRLYLTHFAGEACTGFQTMGFAQGPVLEAWASVAGSLGLEGAALGQQRRAPAGAPSFSGLVEAVRDGKHPYTLVLLNEPAPGAAFLTAGPMGGQTFISISFYLYGQTANAVARREEPLWQAWMAKHFPAASGAKS
ncbi:MAG: SRPBCC domain-containing protein [Candidatus Solibacter usitatus]|nr:SRPBCC domain-containing protein [Candidatus Solibacter usitatus]